MINTLLIIVQQVCMHMPLVIGAYISLSLMKVPDLSLETAFMVGALCGSMSVVALSNMPLLFILVAALMAALVGGALVGTISSSITQYGKLPHLLSCIITFGIFHGLVQMITSPYISLSSYVNPLASTALFVRQPELLTLLIVSVVAMACSAFLLSTQLGYTYAVFGMNPRFFRNYGISISSVFISGIVVSNALAGLSGYLCAQSNGFAEMNMGIGKVLMCITSLILGKTLFKTLQPFSIFIPIIGCLSYFVVQQALLKIGFNIRYFTALQALIVLVILIIHYRNQTDERVEHLGV